jgi:AcrR family transcriptional regulator
MPRAGLDAATVAAAGAAFADEHGFANLTMNALAERLGVRTPSLYKHVGGQADLHRRIAVLALDNLADSVGKAIQGYAGRDALAAAAYAIRAFVTEHPGQYAATLGATPGGPDDPLTLAGDRLMAALTGVLRGYPVKPDDLVHSLRTLRSLFHGFATLQAARGFQLRADVDDSFEWLITFADRGLRSAG